MTTIRDAFQSDHRRLDALFEDLLNCVHVDDSVAAHAAWMAFERGLAAHLEAEESDMLPIFERRNPADAAAVRADHAKIRTLLADLGVMLDLHRLREEKVQELVAFLRAHAAREEAVLYRWADSELPEAPKTTILERLDAARRTLSARARKLVGELGGVLIG